MGHELLRAIAASPAAKLAGLWVRRDGQVATAELLPHDAAVVSTELDAVLQAADVAIDFSLPTATAQVLDAAAKANVPLVCGVTGLGAAELEKLARVAQKVPLLYDRNMSPGIAVLADLARQAAERLGRHFELEVHETHHVHKKDAPSGTALALGEVLAAARNRRFTEVFRYDAAGEPQRETPDDILFHATRQGEVPGDHTVVFRSETECLRLTHSVTDRRVFAQGALQAAHWLAGQPAGRYRMTDVLADISR